jgi:predicted alpha/beta superfamily hydrolase
MRKLLFIFSVLLASHIGSVTADSVDTAQMQGIGDISYHLFESETLGHPLHLFVRVPVSDPESDQRTYPTVYLLDGGVNFPLLSSYYHYLLLAEEIPEMILVGISYGSDTFEGGNFRSSDFTAPAADREWWGKAPIFQRVLKEELIPLIESSYPSDDQQRIIFGQSLGGQFVLYTALTDPALFHGHIASNPALHRNLDFFLHWQGDNPMPKTASRVFVSLAENDDQRFQIPAQSWVAEWEPKEPKPWLLEVRLLNDQSHLSAAPMAFRQGIRWLNQSGSQ